MRDTATPSAMQCLCSPRSIAVVGASEDRGKFGGRVMHQLVRHGYAGTLYPINPSRDRINGLEAFARIADVPEPPDAAVVAVPPAALLSTLDDCIAGGVGVAIVITGNLSADDIDGDVLQSELVARARAGGVRLLGPNCLGVISPPTKLAFSPSVTMAVEHLPAGPVGIASQSGALMTAMFIRGHDAGIGFSRCISVGNQADLELADAFDYLVEDEATGAICLYVEGIKNRARFIGAAERARDAGKPVIAVKAGRTDAGASMASSHTGALAGSYDAFAALARRLGIVLTDQAEAAVLCADALARHGAPKAPGLAVVSSSGGAAVLSSDAVAEDPVLAVADLRDETRRALERFTDHCGSSAMLDLGGYRIPFQLPQMQRSFELLADDPGIGALLYVMTPQPLMVEIADVLADLSAQHDLPIAFVSTAGSVAAAAHERLRSRAIAVHPSIDDALRVLRALMDYRRHRARPIAQPTATLDVEELAAASAGLDSGLLTEPEVKRLLRAAGVPVTIERLARDGDEAAAHANTIGYPVVLKGVARGLVHKSDIGAVALDLGDEPAVRFAFASIVSAIESNAPQAQLIGCVVQEMAMGGVAEAFVGARFDPQHGPVVLVGAGGVLVELLDDVQVLAAPVTSGQARAALERLRCWRMLDGMRSRPASDIDALAEVVARVSQLIAELDGRLLELDLNPLLLRERGAGALALDARGVWTTKETRQ